MIYLGKHGAGTGRRLAAEFLLRETTQSCEGAMKSLRSDACSAGENLLEDMAGDRRALPGERRIFSSPPVE
jgi:hypothetical protein